MTKLNSLAVFAGTDKCNANCKHCAGKSIRGYAPKRDGIINEGLIRSTIRKCYDQGARYLSISSGGEPTLSPLAITRVLKLVQGCGKEGIHFSPINLYSNGIRMGTDRPFCEKYLPLWKGCGLTTIYVTVHSVDETENARIYGVKYYPPLERVLSRIHGAGLLMRANLVLSRETVSTLEKFAFTIRYLIDLGVDNISAWPIRDQEDKVSLELSPPESELDKMEDWIEKNGGLGHRIRLLRENSRIVYQTGQKLTRFPNGIISNTWCNAH
jgi:MoaA/NifB/PqqE/SkfB family radical SAM enzyme